MLLNIPIVDYDFEDDNFHTEEVRQIKSRPLNEMLYQKLDKQTSELECLCERIKDLEIQRTNTQKHHHILPSKESASAPPSISYLSPINLPPIGELIDYQSIMRRVEELERNSILANHELGRLRRENVDLNDKIPLLVQVEVNLQLKKFKKEINDGMISNNTLYPSNPFESKPQRVVVSPPPEPEFQRLQKKIIKLKMASGRTKQNKIEKSSLEIAPISSHPSFNYFTYQKDDATKPEQPYSPCNTFENFDDKTSIYFAAQRNTSFEQIQTIYDYKFSLPSSHPSSNYLSSQRDTDFDQLHTQIKKIYDYKASLKNIRYLKHYFSNDHLIRYTKSEHFNSLSEKIKRLINLLIYEILSDEFRLESLKLSQKLEEYIKRNLIPELPNGCKSYTEFEYNKAFKFLSKMQKKRVKKLVRLENNNNMTTPKRFLQKQKKSYKWSNNYAVKHGGLIVICADDIEYY
ncbi:3743_t:CDS:2 [Funneliformis geosporum]|nr:3743_t:CDS:2 [Funneliformis geosporum]